MLLFVHPYLRGFMSVAHRLLSLVCVAFFLGIVWFDLGAGLNVPALVWHADPLLQFTAGFSITALFAYVWLVTYILDTRFHPDFIRSALERDRPSIPVRVMHWLLPRAPGTGADPADPREGGDGLRWYLGVTFLPCTALLLLPVFFAVHLSAGSIRFTDPDSDPADQAYIVLRWPFAVGVLVAVIAVRALAGAGGLLVRRWLKTESGKFWVRASWLHGTAAVLFLILAILYTVTAVLVWRDLWQPPPVTAVCMLIGLFVGVGGAIWFHLRYWAVPVFGVGIGWLIYCNRPDYKVRFPYLDAEYAELVDLRDYDEPVTDLAEFEDTEAGRMAATQETGRVARLIASRVAQRDPAVPRGRTVEGLEKRGLTDPRRYAELREEYLSAMDDLVADEKAVRENWKRQFPGARRPVLVLVTATGGANRSALWTAKVLHALHTDRELTDFPKHVRVIAGASGGMVGAAYYVGSLQPGGVLVDGFRPKDVAQDFLTPIINGTVYRELPFLGVPTDYYQRDRGEMLDLAMEGEAVRVPDETDEEPLPGGGVGRNRIPGEDVRKRLRAALAQSFDQLDPGERAGWRPSLIFSPMIVEDGRRVFISNRHVPFLTVNRGEFLFPNRRTGGGVPAAAGSEKLAAAQAKLGTARSQRIETDDRELYARSGEVYSRPGVEFFHLFPRARPRFRLSTAARMNASFPFLSPAVSLPTTPVQRVVDAGYYDNTGVGVAAAWLYHHADWVAANCGGVVIIQVRDSTGFESREVAEGKSILPGLTGVVSALGSARTATTTFRNDADLHHLNDYFQAYFKSFPDDVPPGGTAEFFTTAVFALYMDVGMNWYLSPADKADILDSWDTGLNNLNQASLRELKKWWKAHNR